MTKSHILAASACAAFCFAATSASAENLYFHGFVGANFTQDATLSGIVGGAPQSVLSDFESGVSVGGAVGRSFGGGWRAEVELSYHNSDIDTLDFTGNALSPEINTSGGIERTALMANVLYDIQTGSKLTPYVGAGLGATWTDFDLVYGPGVRINETDTTFSAQLIAGVAYAVTDSTSVTADLRYARAFDVSSTRLNGAGGVTGVVSDDIDALSLNFGVRVGF